MLKKAWFCTFCLFLLTVGCTSTNSTNSRQDSPNNPNEITTSNTDRRNKLRGRIEQISKTAQGRMGVTATVLETGESVSLNGNQRFPMQSVYKFPIAMAVLDRVDRGKLKLDQKIRIEASDVVRGSQILDQKAIGVELTLTELLKYMVSSSDNTACDVLLRLVGEPKIVTQYLRGLGVKDIVVANTEQELRKNPAVQYRNDATPDAAVGLLRTFHEGKGLSTSSQALLRRLMTETTTGKQRIRGLLPKGTVVAHKTGTSATVKGVTAATNDVGIVTLPNGQNLAIAVFVSDSPAEAAIRERSIAQVTRTVWDEWSK
ncbi:class A beta-lactamase [Chamaesiphon sp. OTE_20_metabat_361]|uniref:class A beta-lactamase n=1 Tax=Chamaesiphon sp. OTE_20_metabat_361 TaxID=2964689 RepID=UPI00286B566B|nr:class A beta-lactamase [Chamaesiphon sp. OTE_20_metabat_361]